MNRFSILLIENEISTTVDLVSALGEQLPDYCLSVVQTIDEALDDALAADAILVNLLLIDTGGAGNLSALQHRFPDASIFLLVPPPAGTAELETKILSLLEAGASDYVELSPAGFIVLTRRLVAIQTRMPEQPRPALTPSSNGILRRMIASEDSDLALQLIGADNRIRIWNHAAEALFDIQQEVAIGSLVDDLPLLPADLSRLKDLIDQARAIRAPFHIAQYSIGSNGGQGNAALVYVYPVVTPASAAGSPDQTEIYIVIAPIHKPETISREQLNYNQELQILLEANREISQQLELRPTLEKVIEQIKSLLYGDNCQIYFLEKDNKTLRPVLALGPMTRQIYATTLSAGSEPLSRLIAKGHAVLVSGAEFSDQLSYLPDEQLLCAPLTAVRGIIGLIVVSRRRPEFSPDDLRFFESLVQQASSAISNARLFEETQRSLNELAILYSASTVISTHWDDQDVLDNLIQQVVDAMAIDRGFIFLWNKERDQGQLRAESPVNSVPETAQDRLAATLKLANRETMLKMLSQQRPIFLHLGMTNLDEIEQQEMEKYGAQSRLIVPLLAKGETIGWLELWDTQKERAFTADEVRLSRALSSQIAVALQNSQYLEQTRRTLEEATALYRVTSALTTLQDPQAIISTVLREYLRALDLKQGSVVLFDLAAKQGTVKAHVQDDNPRRPGELQTSLDGQNYKTQEGQQIPLTNNPVYARLMRRQQAIVIDDPRAGWLTTPPAFAPNLKIPPVGGWGDEAAFSLLIIPIRIREEIVGAIVIENTRHNRPFSSWIISLGQAMADQLGIGLQNVRLYEAEYWRREQAETLREVASIVSSSLNLDEVLERVLDQLGRVVKYDSAAIHLIEERRRRVIAGRGFAQPERHIGLTFPIILDESEPGSMVINHRKPLVFGNIPERFSSFRKEIHSHIRSWMGIPLIARDKLIGLITIDHSNIGAYTDDDVQMALAFANQVAIALENARLYEIEVRELERELEIAQQIQETLLPQTTLKIPGLDIAGRISPARQVGGDFFHFFSTGADQLGVAIGDVSGKGIPAALYMAAGITAIDIQIGPDTLPGELLNRLNRKLYTRLHENKMNIALQIATFMPFPNEAGEHPFFAEGSASLMTIASAGMIAPIGATEHGCRLLPVGALPIGAVPTPTQEYMDDVFLIDPATAVIFTSDGIVEAQNITGELFGFERLEETILKIVHTQNAGVIADHIISQVQQFVGDDVEQHDDMTVVVVVKK